MKKHLVFWKEKSYHFPMVEREQDLGKGDKLLVRIRKILHGVWEETFKEGGWHGRTWGLRGPNAGPFGGSHIVIGDQAGNVVLINLNRGSKSGEAQMHEFTPAGRPTPLGDEIANLLGENGIEIKRMFEKKEIK